MRIYKIAENELAEIENFLANYVEQNGGVNSCRHGGCFEFVEDFYKTHNDAELWETWELPDHMQNLPLALEYDKVEEILRQEGVDSISDLGALGGHAVVKWRGYVFDAAGISTFEEITKYFHSLDNVHWIRTM